MTATPTTTDGVQRRKRKPDRLLLALARLEPPLAYLDWFHYQTDRVWICQYRHFRQTDHYRIRPGQAAELRHLALIEPVELAWNRDRYVLTPNGLSLLIRKGRMERAWAKRERDARFVPSHRRRQGGVSELRPIRSYIPPSVWRRRALAQESP